MKIELALVVDRQGDEPRLFIRVDEQPSFSMVGAAPNKYTRRERSSLEAKGVTFETVEIVASPPDNPLAAEARTLLDGIRKLLDTVER